MRRVEVEIRAGRLSLALQVERLPLEEVVTFATRENPKRPYLFVSKVLGRHWPCRPRRMRQTYDLLAAELFAAAPPVMVFGVAETATGLGHGVFDSLTRALPGAAALYQHTTRHHLRRDRAFRIREGHSHAVDHWIYQPSPPHREIFRGARTLALVDDEITTGRTLSALARSYLALNPRIERIQLLTLVSWLTPRRREELERELGRPVAVAALVAGSFRFTPSPGFAPPPLPRGLRAESPGRHVAAGFGRTGLRGAYDGGGGLDLPPASRVAVVGTGEFAFPPFRLAEDLERGGHDVVYQCSTRSPILVGDGVRTKLAFPDHHSESVTNYLYNFPDDGRVVVVGYEHPALGRSHRLVDLLHARPWSPAR